ncbi:hypothetical protein HDU86_003151 [Geranomyces michiganensis]|nr:hypothetical protein HDU86_003151 [Geranomyces michiganensis]
MLTHLHDSPPRPRLPPPAGEGPSPDTTDAKPKPKLAAGRVSMASSPSSKRKAEANTAVEQSAALIAAAAAADATAVPKTYYHPQVRRTGSGEILARGDGATAVADEEPAKKRVKLLERRLRDGGIDSDGNTIGLPGVDFPLHLPAGQYTPGSEAGGGGAGGGGLGQHTPSESNSNSHFATSEVAKLALTISQSSHWSHDNNDIFSSGPFSKPSLPQTPHQPAPSAATTSSCALVNNNRSLEPTSASSVPGFGSPVAMDHYPNQASAFSTPCRRSVSAVAAGNDDATPNVDKTAASAAEPPVFDASAGGQGGGGGGTGNGAAQNVQDDTAQSTRKKRKSPHFTEAEDDIILKGYEKFGDNWQQIIVWGNLDPEVRTAASVRGRFSRLPAARKKGVVPPDPDVHQQQQQPSAKPILSNHSTGSLECQQQQQQQPHETPGRQQQRGPIPKNDGALPHLLWSPSGDAGAAGGGGGPGGGANGESTTLNSGTCSPSGKASTKKIHEYFHRSAGAGGSTGKRPRLPAGGDDEGMQHMSLHDELPTDAEDDLMDLMPKPAQYMRAAPPSRDAVVHERLLVELEQARAQLAHASELNETLRNERDAVAKAREDLLDQVTSLEMESDALRRDAQKNIKSIESRAVAELAKARARIVDVLRAKARSEAREVRQKAAKESLRLGGLKYDRHGIGFHERWESGYLAKEQEEALEALVREREEIERKRKLLSKRLKHSKATAATADAPGADFPTKSDTSNPPPPSLLTSSAIVNAPAPATSTAPIAATTAPAIDRITQAEYFEHSEIYSLRLAALKREETELRARQAETHRERTAHIREMRRIAEEDRSRFSHHPVLNDRYLLLHMIGKGGFSEVYKAFDLVELRTVACKIHSLNDQWGEERKEFYIKHSLREYRIQKILDHPRVVKLFDVFEYDHLSFCTVMEYVCEGKDLESHLGMVKTVPEREARSIITQVVAALRYLNELDQPIIHYDLKPGNILYFKGEVKVTDFGLSKIVEQSEPSSFRSAPAARAAAKDIELTSIGAGTYFYLPPEVFLPQPRNNTEPLTISSKVDVWSLGCVFFELLYGIKPFGNDQSQQTILKEGTITRDAIRLEFPAKPAVSQETKTFILKCLEYRKDKRPDVLTL